MLGDFLFTPVTVVANLTIECVITNYLTGNSNINLISSFVKDESGATAIEYGLIAALVAVVLIVALTALGTGLEGLFTDVTAQL